MRIVDRYVARNLLSSTLTVLLTLLGLFTFFALIDELEDVGRGSYGIIEALVYVAMSVPGLAYEMFPMAALIGSLLGLGAMMGNGEITVVRSAGVSKFRLVFSVMKAGILFVCVVMLIGELIAPPAESFSRRYRSSLVNDGATLKTNNGFWARDANSYINIREVLPGNQIRDIYIYEFDDGGQLRASTHAERALYVDKEWVLEGISQTVIATDNIESRHVERAAWDSLLRPELISMVAIDADSLSVRALLKYIKFLKDNGQTAQHYEHALWVKLTYPIATGVMVFLAIPMVMRANRSTTVGKRVLVGGLIGLGFHLTNQAAGHLGIVYEVDPALTAGGPAVVMGVIGLVLLWRTA